MLMKVTTRCNSNCEYCAHRYSNNLEHRVDIPTVVLKKVAEEAGAMGVRASTISGGEPLVREDIAQVIAALVHNHVLPVLLTNGLLLPKKWAEIGEAGLRYLIISIDSLDPDVYERQRGARFEDVIAGIRAAVALRERYPETRIHVTTVLTKDSALRLEEFVKTMSEHGIYTQISPYHHYDGRLPNELRIDDPEVAFELTGKLLRMKREGYLIANSREFLSHVPDFFLKNQRMPDGFRCFCGYTNLAIDAHMNVRCCWDGTFKPVGNLGNQSLTQIWNSSEYQTARERMLECKCSGCWYLCTTEAVSFLLSQLD